MEAPRRSHGSIKEVSRKSHGSPIGVGNPTEEPWLYIPGSIMVSGWEETADRRCITCSQKRPSKRNGKERARYLSGSNNEVHKHKRERAVW